MKKLLFSTALLLSFCYLLAQTNDSQKDKQSTTEDVLFLQKSNASLKIQLKEQKSTLLKQIKKTDSIILVLQSANSEIKKGADNQSSITQSVNNLQEQSTNISQSLSKRKLYAIIIFIGSVVIVLIYLLYLKTKSVAINKNIKQLEENLNKQLSGTQETINKMNYEINKTIENQILLVKGIFHEQLSQSANELSEKILDVNKTIEKKIAAIKK